MAPASAACYHFLAGALELGFELTLVVRLLHKVVVVDRLRWLEPRHRFFGGSHSKTVCFGLRPTRARGIGACMQKCMACPSSEEGVACGHRAPARGKLVDAV